MRLDQLKYLVDIAQTGSITSTSQRFFVTQQAVSKSIKQLESELDTDILIRTNAGVSFTTAGEEVVAFAQQVLAEEAALMERLKGIKSMEHPAEAFLLNICSTSAVTNIVLPTIIANLTMQQKHVSVNISMTDSFNVVMERLTSGSSDLGLMTINERELIRKFEPLKDDFQCEILARDEMIVVMDKKYYKGDKDYVTLEEFNACPRTLYNIVPVDALRYDAYRSSIICSTDADFHRSMMEKAGSMTLMPALAHQYFFNSKKYVALSVEDLDETLIHAALYRQDVSEQVKNFTALIRREMYMN